MTARAPKILFALLPERGHVNPFIGVAQALVDEGADVTVVSHGDIARQIAGAGLHFDPGVLAPDAPAPARGRALVELLNDPARYRTMVESFVFEATPAHVGPMRACLERVRPDVVVLDPMYHGAAVAAHVAGVKWCGVSTALSQVLVPEIQSPVLSLVAELAPRRQELFAALGFPDARFRGADVLAPDLNVTFATREFVGDPPAGVELVGPSAPIRARGDEDGEPSACLKLPTDRPIVCTLTH